MPKLADVLKAANVKDEVIAGLPPEVVAAADGFAASAEQQLADAKEELRKAGLTKKEIEDYVAQYGSSLDQLTTLRAENAMLKTGLEKLKADGINIDPKILPTTAQPAVPGSPARGENVDFSKIKGEVNGVVNQLAEFEDARDEYFRLTGRLIPEGRTKLIQEAAQARKPLGEYIAEKYKFDAIRQEKSDADLKAKLDAARNEGVAETEKKYAEARGNNPFTASGQPSAQPYVKQINHEDFQKVSGREPSNVRHRRMIENIHKDLAAQQGA